MIGPHNFQKFSKFCPSHKSCTHLLYNVEPVAAVDIEGLNENLIDYKNLSKLIQGTIMKKLN